MTISFSPFLALLIAFGWFYIYRHISQLVRRFAAKKIYSSKWPAIALLLLLFAINYVPFRYMDHYKKMDPRLAAITLASYEMSDIVRKNVRKNEKLLILPMVYRTGSTMGDPILEQYINHDDTFYFKGSNWNYENFKKTVQQNKIKWLLIFPFQGGWQVDLFNRISQDKDITGYMFSVGYILKVDAYWTDSRD
ncbi:MAG: hypothetical protein JRF02_01120, partial [Deltaproteobacteria bacterium]|jgi:hypothetical protein|nr:hypothetical protein [Deltaproteobacteria bacterium]